MTLGWFESQQEMLILGGIIGLACKFVWDRWLSKTARVSPDSCRASQEMCRAAMLKEFYAFKLGINNLQAEQTKKMEMGDGCFQAINSRLDRANLLLESIISIQLKMCHDIPTIDCEDLQGLLIKQGIEVGINKRREA